MNIVVSALLLVVLVFVGYPLVHGTPSMQPSDVLDAKTHLVKDEHDRIVTDLKELELDHTAGRVPDAEYNALRVRYRQRAMILLSQLDQRRDENA